MPGKHVRFDGFPSPSISPPAFNNSGSAASYLPLPRIACQLHPALSSHYTSILWDLRLPHQNAQLSRGVLLNEPATHPPLPHMIITCPSLPKHWDIRVKASQPGIGVTVGDVLYAIYHDLRPGISKAEFEQMSIATQRSIRDAWIRRYQEVAKDEPDFIKKEKATSAEMMKGLKRVDYLEERTKFYGMRRTVEGPEEWELVVSS